MKLTKPILIAFILFVLVYLLGAFHQVSFNIINWSVVARSVIVVIGGFLALISGLWTFLKDLEL
jgi:hypothetical protein